MTEQDVHRDLDLRMRKNSSTCRDEIMTSTFSEVVGMSTLLNETTADLAVYLIDETSRRCIKSTDGRRTTPIGPSRYRYGQRVAVVQDKKSVRVTDSIRFDICARATRTNGSTGEVTASEGFIDSIPITPEFFSKIGITGSMAEVILYNDVRFMVTVDVYKRKDHYMIAGCNIIVEPDEPRVAWPLIDANVDIQSLGKMRLELCKDFADKMLSMPIWHNQFMVRGDFDRL